MMKHLQMNLHILRSIRACYSARVHPNHCLSELMKQGITDQDLARYRGWRASSQGEVA